MYTIEAINVKIQIGSAFHFLDNKRGLYETLASEENLTLSFSSSKARPTGEIMRVSIDVGGTFTDAILVDGTEGKLLLYEDANHPS